MATIFRLPTTLLPRKAYALFFLLALSLSALCGCSQGPQLSSPNQLALGPDGRIYVVNLGQGNILQYDPATWTITNSFGKGLLDKVYALDIDRKGRILTANVKEGKVTLDGGIFSSQALLFNPDGQLAESFGQGCGLRYVLAGCFDSQENVLLSDAGRNGLALFSSQGKGVSFFDGKSLLGITEEAGQGGQPFKFFYCTDLQRDPAGRIWAVDSYACSIRVFKTSYTNSGQVSGLSETGHYPPVNDRSLLNFPQAIAFSREGDAFITDTGNRRLVVLGPDLTLKGTIPLPEQLGDEPFLLSGIAILDDSREMSILMSDSTNSRLILTDMKGKLKKIIPAVAK